LTTTSTSQPDSESSKEWTVDELLADPAKFILFYFPHRIEKLEPFHEELIRISTTESRSLILYPAAHGKTTLISTLLPIWAICKDPNVRISIIARNSQDARSIMRAIQYELLANTDLIEDFGPFQDKDDKTKPWSTEQIKIMDCTRRDPRATIEVFGQGGNVLGHRADWVICDDVVTEKNSATEQNRHSLKEWFTLGVSTMPEHTDSRLTVVGTLFDPQDLYHDIIDLRDPYTGEESYNTSRFSAILDHEEHRTLWEERWPWKRLMIEKAQLGTLQFNKRYCNVAVDPSMMFCREEYLTGGYIGKTKYPGCLDREWQVGGKEDTWRLAAGFDPAVGSTRSAKFCAHLILAERTDCPVEGHTRCFQVVDLVRDQMTLPQQVELILSQHREFGVDTSVIEANSYQQGLYQAVETKMNELGEAFRINPHYTSRTNKPDPITGVQSMSRWFEDGKIHIPWKTTIDQHRLRQLYDELVQFPGRTTDTVMAFWFAWKALQDSRPAWEATSYLKRPVLPQQRSSRRSILNPYYHKTGKMTLQDIVNGN